jgi:hypothetical protein
MIKCPKCGATQWKQLFMSAINPDEDEFYCLECRTKFRRYDKPDSVTISIPEDITSINLEQFSNIANRLYIEFLKAYDDRTGVATAANLHILSGLGSIQQAVYFFKQAELVQARETR